MTEPVWHFARWEPPADETVAEAAAALRELVVGRDDGRALLAHTAGLLLGFHDRGPSEARARNAAKFYLAADADPALMPEWEAIGKERPRWRSCRHSAGRGSRPGGRTYQHALALAASR